MADTEIKENNPDLSSDSAPENSVPDMENKNIRWYVIHTYSGYENKVLDTLRRKVQNSEEMRQTIRRIELPMHDEEEIKDGEKRIVSRKVFPGYLLIEMEVNDRSWYVVRNTPGVTGFVGTTTKPIPLTDEEAERILNGGKKAPPKIHVNVGDTIRITAGAFAEHTATVREVAADKSKIKADLIAFGHTSTIELEAGSFEPLP